MRVVWITHNYPRYPGDVAGAFLHPLAVALRRLDVDVRVVAPSDAGSGGAATLDGVPVTRVRYGTAHEEQLAYRGTMMSALGSPSRLMAFIRMRAALRSGADQELAGAPGPALVHAHWWVPSGLASPRTAPLVLTCHGTDVRLLDRFPAAWIAGPTFRRAKVVTVVSRALAETIRRRIGITVAHGEIQPMPVVDATRPWSDRTGGVVVIGRLTEQKRVQLAIEALAITVAQGHHLTLTVVGDGRARQALEHRATTLGVAGAVRFVGAVSPLDVPAILATAACCIMPAKNEGFGLAAAEALMQGVPVVACTDGGGLQEIVPPAGAGRLVPPSAPALAAGLLDVLADPQAAAAARTAGTAWRARLSADAVAQRCLTWYQRALLA